EPDRYVQGIGKQFAGSLHARDGAPNANVIGVDGALSVELSCGTGTLRLYVRNLSGRRAQLAITAADRTASTTSVHRAVPNGGGAFAVVDANLAHGTAQVANGDVVATASFSASALAGAGCDAAAQVTATQLV